MSPAPERIARQPPAAERGKAPLNPVSQSGAKDIAEPATPKKKRRKLLLVILVVLILAVGFWFVKLRAHPTVYKPGDPVPPGQVFSLGTLTVNTSTGGIVQLGIDLQLTKPANAKALAADVPQLKNAAIADVSKWSYAALLTPQGRHQLQSQLLQSFQTITGTVDGAAPQVSSVYFTSFLQQS